MRCRWLEQTAGLAVVILAMTAYAAEARVYQLAPGDSSVRIHVGKAGFLKGLGHEHNISARAFSGHVNIRAADLAGSQVSATFESRSLTVLPDGEPPKDIPEVQATMLGPEVLDADRFPHITITSRRSTAKAIGPGVFAVQLSADLSLHGVVRPISLPLRVELAEHRVVARGATTIRQTDFGITPVSVAGGTIKVKNEVTIQFTFVGRA